VADIEKEGKRGGLGFSVKTKIKIKQIALFR